MLYPCNALLFGHIKNEVLIHATIWMNLEDTILSERSQSQKAIDSIDSIEYRIGVTYSKIGNSTVIESRLVIAKGWGYRENGE